MAADPSRLVDVRGILPGQLGELVRTRSGSGLIVGPGLILTAAHVVSAESRWLPVRVRTAGATGSHDGEVLWPPVPGDLDLALISIPNPPPEWPARAVRWGRFTGRSGDRPVDAAGYPEVVRDSSGREVHHLVGRVNPQAGLERGRLRLEVSCEPASWADPQSPWAGFSGAALMSGDLVVGVIVIDTPGFAHRVLTVVPVTALLVDETAQKLLGVHLHGDSVELDALLEPRSRFGASRSPAQLLRAEQETIPFLGRHDELTRLTEWATSEERLGVRLVTGPGGRGKTRLAQEMTHRLARDRRWVTGILESRSLGKKDLSPIVETTTNLRVLLMVDYAESRVEQVCEILCAVDRAVDPPHLRILLLARDRGDWWENDLLQRHEDLEDIAEHVALPELHPFGERTEQFYECAREFARRLPPIVPEVDWQERLSAATPPDLTQTGYGDPLSIQLAAMLALLGEVDGVDVTALENRLIRHEKAYWQHVLDVRGLELESHVRDQAVAAATLFSVAGRQAALRLLQRVPELTTPGPVATWLSELYPHAKHYWGPLQPDRLGEHHIGAVSSRDPDFLHELFADTSVDEAEAALVVVGRAMAHQPHLEEQVRRLLDEGTPGIAEAVKGAARFVPNPRLFLRGLGQRQAIDLDYYTSVSEDSHWSGPTRPPGAADLNADAAELRAIIDDAGANTGPWILSCLLELVENRGKAHDLDAAMSAAQEAVSMAVRMNDPAHRAEALIARSGAEADLGMLERALATSQEAVEDLERSGAATSGEAKASQLLGRALSNVAALMQRAGRNQEAYKYSTRAIARLADVDSWYSDQTLRLRAEVTHGSIAASMGLFAEARTTLDHTVVELDRLIGSEPEPPVETIALRAAARSNLGACLDEMGDPTLAIPVLAKSIDDYTTVDDAQFAPEIARTSVNLAELASRQGDPELADEAARRTISEIARWHIPSTSSTESGIRHNLLDRASRVLAGRN
jgi:tetratricopeptide (TPR) repeat protein